jgi:malonate transporter and related proteins
MAWIDAFLPTFGLIGLGFLLKALTLRDDAFWAGLERLTFFVLLPALLAWSISTIDLRGLPIGGMAGAIWPTLLLATGASIAIALALGHDRAAMTSIVQGGIRFNNYMAFAIAAGLYGQAGLAFIGVAAGLIVPFVQVILTLVFVLSAGRSLKPLLLFRQIGTNPLLLGCLAGFAFAAFGGMPPGLLPFSRALGQAALALGLLTVGAALVPGSLREAPLTQLLVGGLKLLLVPLMTFGLLRVLAVDPIPASAAILAMATPTATTGYVMARLMGGDARLMAATITLQHLAAVITLPLWALLLAR